MQNEKATFSQALWPILFFFAVLIFGLFLQPLVFNSEMLPLEVLILFAFTFSCVYLISLGYSWDTIMKHVTKKVGESIGVILILFSIGVLIGSWIVAGTIPMLIYYGVSIVDPNWIYIFAFLVCIIFSLLTGTSWGSAGTIGIVMISIAQAYDASLVITAAAIVGGSFFGDKMSPLSDTTNIASLATGVPLFDHIRSMVYTTGPSAILAAALYIYLSPYFSDAQNDLAQPEAVAATMQGLKSIFNFNLLLLLPMAVVIWGTMTKKPIVLTLLGSAWLAMILAIIFQDFSLPHIIDSFNKGFSVDGLQNKDIDPNVLKLLNRGGLYNLIGGIVSCFLIFAFIGTLDVIDAIDTLIKHIMKYLKKPTQLIAAALTATAVTNLTVSNQYATSFIIGEAFKRQFDNLKVPRKVLSRSIEDAGTMLENLVPWTPTGLFMMSTLGVSAIEYAPYQFLSIINIIIAYIFAFTGIACYKNEGQSRDQN